ncbi:MAG: excisionase family DNA-binding protein [Planctomycetaceae bacterium]|nr:excisionase family DNA-binding protein [Planctomycetaceae bacterium]
MSTKRKTFPTQGLAKTSEAAEFLNCSNGCVRRWCQQDRIDHVMIGTHYRIEWSVLHDFAAGKYRLRGPKREEIET